MSIALGLARKNEGLTHPNPSVGCVVVGRDGGVISVGTTAYKGRPHAEQVALEGVVGADCVYVTLEPCSHYGATPPCVNAIIKSGAKKVVIAVQDPDANVNGKGVLALQNAGIEVVCGVLENEVRAFYGAYFFTRTHQKPYITAKIVTSLDGKIATASGESKWISSEQTRRYTNFLRSRFDGILIGTNTYLKDSPRLDSRNPGLENFQPKRFLLSHSIKEAQGYIVVNDETNLYTEYGVNRLLIEGGGGVISSFLQKNLVNELIVVRSPIVIGCDGLDSIGVLGVNKLSDLPKFHLKSQRIIAGDVVEFYSLVETCKLKMG